MAKRGFLKIGRLIGSSLSYKASATLAILNVFEQAPFKIESLLRNDSYHDVDLDSNPGAQFVRFDERPELHLGSSHRNTSNSRPNFHESQHIFDDISVALLYIQYIISQWDRSSTPYHNADHYCFPSNQYIPISSVNITAIIPTISIPTLAPILNTTSTPSINATRPTLTVPRPTFTPTGGPLPTVPIPINPLLPSLSTPTPPYLNSTSRFPTSKPTMPSSSSVAWPTTPTGTGGIVPPTTITTITIPGPSNPAPTRTNSTRPPRPTPSEDPDDDDNDNDDGWNWWDWWEWKNDNDNGWWWWWNNKRNNK
ncbi:hypothetical protein DM02DRAFT_656425 [Periconia macrospinosa]|uniref:Uncharacterized protein n=1 Tax=Periconia macrospinosa TaxID=97972 RepID=A0A2V1DMP3_9PLEO|nr:hypothetical protein DM02DRAFT_656425 [Periconia macrospinosa]